MPRLQPENRGPREVEENKEDIRLIYLHHDSDNRDDVKKVLKKLKSLNPAAEFYTDLHSCLNLIRTIRDECLFLIVSDLFASKILAEIEGASTVVAVFVLSGSHHYQLSETETKRIVKIFTNVESLIESIHDSMGFFLRTPLAFSLFDQKERSIRDLTNESNSFVWYQLLIHVLKQIPNDEKSKAEMLTMCRAYYRKNRKELKNINRFEETYTSSAAIRWYTMNCFLYKLLNRAIRTEDILLLYMFRFYMIDLCTEIERESRNATDNDQLTLYRGQILPESDISKLKYNVGHLISFFGFVSTTRNREVALEFAKHHSVIDGFPRVLFEIEVDRSLTAAVFADIANQSKYNDEEEVLFTLNACFEIVSIDFNSSSDVWNVRLKATDESSSKSQTYLESIEEEMQAYTPLIYYGRLVLYEFGRVNQAKDYFYKLRKLLSADHPALAFVYDHLGHVHNHRDELNLALENYERAYEIYKQNSSSDHPHIVRALNHLGTIHERKGNLEAALKHYRKAKWILKRHSPDDHLGEGMILESMGIVCRAKRDFDQALKFLSRALHWYQCAPFPPTGQIAQCLGYLGLVCEDKNDLTMALDYYQKQLQMEEEYLPADQWRLYEHIHWIVRLQIKRDRRDEAWEFCQEKYRRAQQTLGATHLHVARMKMMIAELTEDEDPNQALALYDEAVSILSASTKPDDRSLAQCFLAMANLHNQQTMLNESLQCDEQAVEHIRRCLPSNHIDLAHSLKNLGMSFRAMNKMSRANQCFSESLSIYRVNYPAKHVSMQLYSIILTDLIDQSSATSTHELERHKPISIVTDQTTELASEQSVSASSITQSTPGLCVIL